LHKFYEEREQHLRIENQEHPLYDISQDYENQMSREYLRAWNIFEKEVPKILPKLK
jgi:hypothetical protein